jgi:uncharacterized iron-regulated membrane protein
MMATLRTAIFWMHLVVGVTAALFILNMAVSGFLIAYERQITALAERSQRAVTAPAGAKRLGIETLAAKAQEARPDARLSGATIYADPSSSALLTVGRTNDPLFVNPYSGEVLGEGHKPTREFFRFMTGWHRWLAQEGTTRPVGKAITGAAAIAYFGLLLSGLWLWAPKRWSWKYLKQITLFKRGLQGKARDWNWHNVIGIWCTPILVFVTLSGIIMSYPWANNLLFRLAGSPPPEQRREGGPPGGGGGRGRGGAEGNAPKLDLTGMDALWTQAEQKVEGWKSISVRFAPSPQAPVVFNIDRGDGGRPDLKGQLTLNRRTGEVVKWMPYADQSTGQKLRFWARFLHTGEAGGWIGQTVAALAAFGGMILVWTGLSLAWRRFFGKGKPAALSLAEPQPALDPAPYPTPYKTRRRRVR